MNLYAIRKDGCWREVTEQPVEQRRYLEVVARIRAQTQPGWTPSSILGAIAICGHFAYGDGCQIVDLDHHDNDHIHLDEAKELTVCDVCGCLELQAHECVPPAPSVMDPRCNPYDWAEAYAEHTYRSEL